jgi:hypothetical protein
MGESAATKSAKDAARKQNEVDKKAAGLQATIASNNLTQQTEQLVNQNKDTQLKINQTEKQRQAQAGLMTAGAAASGLQMTGSVADVAADVNSQFLDQKDSLQRAFDLTAQYTSEDYLTKQKDLIQQGLDLQLASADINLQNAEANIAKQASAQNQQFWTTFGSIAGGIIGGVALGPLGASIGASIGGGVFGMGTNY